jgi:hypothetical protein
MYALADGKRKIMCRKTQEAQTPIINPVRCAHLFV